VHLDGATALGVFSGGRLDGRPAFTVADAGPGRAYYLATIPDEEGSALVVSLVVEAAGVEPVLRGTPERVEAIRRGRLLTVLNHGSEPVTIELPAGTTRLASGEALADVSLDPFGYALLEGSSG
jgi:beta-galactosidase